MEPRYWNPVTETMPREQLRALQWRKLQAAMAHARRGSPFWRERLPASPRGRGEDAAKTCST